MAGGEDRDAANSQTEAVNRQNTELKIESRRKLARDGIIAVRLLDGVLIRIEDDIKKLNELAEQQFSRVGMSVPIPVTWTRRIAKPPLGVVWDTLGVCGPEVVEKYLLLDVLIEQFASGHITAYDPVRTELAKFT